MSSRRKLKPFTATHLNGAGYAMIMRELGYDHARIAAALGVTRWTSIAWKMGRRNISPLAEKAIHGLLLARYAGDLAQAEVERVINRAKQRGRA
jgi:hypothetical protein